MQRTIRIRLDPSPSQAGALAETARQFTLAFNSVCATGWHQRLTNGVELHHATYYGLRHTLPDLPRNLLVQARVKATEALKSALTLVRKGQKVSQPQSLACPPRYNQRTYNVDWESQTVRISLHPEGTRRAPDNPV